MTWTYDPNQDGLPVYDINTRERIADLGCVHTESEEEDRRRDEYGQLIAAAPELLAACEQLLKWAGIDAPADAEDAMDVALDLARTGVEKAKAGSTPPTERQFLVACPQLSNLLYVEAEDESDAAEAAGGEFDNPEGTYTVYSLAAGGAMHSGCPFELNADGELMN